MQKARRVPFQSSGIRLCPTGSTGNKAALRVSMSCYDGLDGHGSPGKCPRCTAGRRPCEPVGHFRSDWEFGGAPKERMWRNTIGTPAGWQSRNNKSAPGERVHYDEQVLRTTRPSMKTPKKPPKKDCSSYHRPLSRPRLPDCIRTSPKINRPA